MLVDGNEKDRELSAALKRLNVRILEPNHPQVIQACEESLLEPYEVKSLLKITRIYLIGPNVT